MTAGTHKVTLIYLFLNNFKRISFVEHLRQVQQLFLAWPMVEVHGYRVEDTAAILTRRGFLAVYVLAAHRPLFLALCFVLVRVRFTPTLYT